MQNQLNPKKRGRTPGSKNKQTIKKAAVENLRNAVIDESLPAETRVKASIALLEVESV